MTSVSERTRRLALYALCLGELMIVLDSSIVNVALPSIKNDLGFSQAALAWVVNAYLLSFGGLLLLGGRIGDLFGKKRMFLGGVVAFTVASIACGVAPSAALLVIGRAVQGIGGAAVSAVALALIVGLFSDSAERAKAMGFYGFVMSGGGALGTLAGGVLTDLLNWHWIFLVNVPIGVVVWMLAGRVLPADAAPEQQGRLDMQGAGLITLSLMLAVYGVVGGYDAGWTSARTLGLLAAAVVLFAAFVIREARAENPLVPLRLFRLRNFAVSQLIGVLWAGAMFAWFLLSALYMQQVLGYDALSVGLAYLPNCVIMAVCSLWVSDRLVMRFGIRPPLIVGLTLVAASLAVLAFAPVDGHYWGDVMPSMVLLGLGVGIAFNPVLLAAMGDVGKEEAGLASGTVNTSFMLGGALGLAVLVSVSAGRTGELSAAGTPALEALNGGFHLAFWVGAAFSVAAAAAGALLRPVPEPEPEETAEPAALASERGSPFCLTCIPNEPADSTL
jgi:EmrB/QacA subfamily drug resistance transporter